MESQGIQAGARPCGPKSKRARSGPRKGQCVPKSCPKKSQTRDKVTGRCRSKKNLKKSSPRIAPRVANIGQQRMAQAVAAARHAREASYMLPENDLGNVQVSPVAEVLDVPARIVADIGSVNDLGRVQVTPVFGPTSAQRRREFWQNQRMGSRPGLVVNRGSAAAAGFPELSPSALAALANMEEPADFQVNRGSRAASGFPDLSPGAMAALANVGRSREIAQENARVRAEEYNAAIAAKAAAEAREAEEQAALEAAAYAAPATEPGFFGRIANGIANFFEGNTPEQEAVLAGGRINYGKRRMAQAIAAARAKSHKKSHKKSHRKSPRKMSPGQRRMAQARAAAARR